jgi:hypothetical protein
MAQHWEARPDGSGRLTDTGPFGHPRSETRFEWRQSQDFVFELRLTERIAFQPDEAVEREEEDRQWYAIPYDLKAVPTDGGAHLGLVEVAEVGVLLDGFLDSLTPLAYGGRAR